MGELRRKAVSGILLVLLFVGMLTMAFDAKAIVAENDNNENEKSLLIEVPQSADYGIAPEGKPTEEQARIVEHRMSALELADLKRDIGVREDQRDYCLVINGHGTGLSPPTEEEWAEISNRAYIVERISIDPTIQSPSSVDHSTEPWFPPIGNQDGEGSCTTWAVGYYMKTFQEAKEHEWDLSDATWEGGYYGYPTPAYQNRIISPDFIYHLTNWGVDQGSSFYNAINLVCSLGASSWEKMPYDPADHTTWPSEEAWREAPLYRGNSSGYEIITISTDAGLTNLKNWIVSDHLAVIGVDGDQYSSLTSQDIWTLDNYVNPSVNHANTIVGFDDTISYVEQGQTRYGAFKIANSWGVGGWEKIADGCYWISYEAMKQRIGYCMFYRDMIGYEPELVSSFRIAHSKRAECSISIGVGDPSNPDVTKSFSQLVEGGDQPFCSNDILFDITEFRDVIPTVYDKSFFLEVGDWGSEATGAVNEFAIEYARSQDTPLNTVQGGFVHAEVSLPPLDTSWTNERLINPDADFIEHQISMATGGNGYLYIAYADLYLAVNQCAVLVKHSTDGGGSWLTDVIGYDSTHDIGYPSIAVDPYSNDICVAVEREWTSSDHDILVLRRVSDVWSWSSVANVLGSDDRFPSITSEYSYGGLNRQYISYEYVYSYDDRDLMLAKSTDHGSTWSIQKLHGNWPDGNVHAQTSITNAEGYIYIAYKWGADYNSPCEIRIDRSTDFGSTWSQHADIDGLSNGCSFPSIAATHGGSSVVVAFQYQWSATDIDVWYSYSANQGSSWTKGKPLFISGLEDEKQPVLTVDGGGTTNDDVKGHFYVVCKSGSYIKYRKAHFSNLLSWSNPEFVSDRWISEGLAVTTQMRDRYSYPCVAWTCGRTRNIYYSTREPGTVSVPDDYSTIQAAINAAHPKETIRVRNGVYYEHLVVNRTVSLIGENPINTILDGSGNGTVISVKADNTTIENFSVKNSGGYETIRLEVNNCEIKNNNITAGLYGLYVLFSSNNRISGNNITDNYWGIWLESSSNNSINGNNITENNWAGIRLDDYCNNNSISRNNIANNGYGIWLWYSSNNIIYHNNFIDNSWPVIVDPSGYANVWDDGYPSGGNCWSDYTGMDLYWGPYQNKTGSDGIGDTPYVIDGNNRDNYPLMSPYEYWNNPISGDINKDMAVDSKDLSQIATVYGSTTEKPNWNPNSDINGDGKVDVLDLFQVGKNYGKRVRAVKVGLVLGVGGLGDKSLNDISYAGVARASQELGIDFDFVEPHTLAEYEECQRNLAATGNYTIIVCVSNDQAAALTVVAEDYPDQKFAIVDGVVDKPNVASLLFKANEGSFLVGVVAGMKTKTGKVGFVGGMDIPLIRDYFVGYEAGAKWANSTVEVVAPVFVGSWADPAKGKELALGLADLGVDAIYVAAGKSGLGALQAVHERGILGLGVDACQCYIYPEIKASMTKRADVAVFDIIKAVVEETFQGGVYRLGLKEEWVGCCRLPEEEDFWEEEFGFAHTQLEISVINEIVEARNKIVAGEITVPSAFP